MSLVRKKKKWLVIGGVTLFAGMLVVVMAFALVSKLKGDEQILEDIDRHFTALNHDEPADGPSLQARLSDTLQVAGPPLAANQKHPASTAPSTRAQRRRSSEKGRRAARRSKARVGRQASLSEQRGIRMVGPATYEIDAPLADAARRHPARFTNGVYATVHGEAGRPIGFRLSGIRPGSALHTLGLRSGDILLAVNGFALKSMDEALMAAGAAKLSDKFRVDIRRAGQQRSLYYRVVPF